MLFETTFFLFTLVLKARRSATNPLQLEALNVMRNFTQSYSYPQFSFIAHK